MGNTLAIFSKEVRGYVNSPISYLFIAIFLAVAKGYYFYNFFLAEVADLGGFFFSLPFLYAFFLPALTMRLWSEEKKAGTIETLLTMPVTNAQLILGKFLASFGLLVVTLVLTLDVVFVVDWLGDVDPGPVVGGYLGAALLGGSFLAMGLFFSSVTENQIIALILTWIFGFLFVFVGWSLITSRLPFFADLSLYTRFANIERGVVDTRDVLFYLSFIWLFLSLNFFTLELRRWK